MQKPALLIVSILITVQAFAQTDDSIFIRRLANEILLHSTAYDNLRALTKGVGGRLAGSPGMVKAEAWGLKAMQNAGADKAFLQACMVPHWVRGGRDEAVAEWREKGKTTSTKKGLDVLALGNSIGSVTTLRAPLMLINSFDELEQQKEAVNGKVVFYNYKFNPTLVRTFQAYADAGRYRREGPSRAAKYGAKAVMVRSISGSTDNHPHTGSTAYNDSFAKIPAIAIGLKDADALNNLVQQNGAVTIALTTRGRFLPDTIGHNVIGELRGTTFPDEYITVGGHLDSWDVAEGAHDDGTGCVQTIEILRAFKALNYQPQRTIRFVLFANEENGTRGAAKYAEEAKSKGEKHIFALESDAGGFTPRGFGFTIGSEQFKKITAWERLLQPYGGGEFSVGGGGSDIAPLNRTQGTPLAGLQPDSQRYFDLHHARSDVFEAVNKRELELGAVNMAALIYLVDKHGL